MHAPDSRTVLALILAAGATWYAPAEAQSPVWTEALLLGASLRLVSEDTIEELRFGPDGAVAITNGKRDGPTTGVAMSWRVWKGKLEVGFPDSYDSFELTSKEGTKVVVRRRSGKKATFDLVRQ